MNKNRTLLAFFISPLSIPLAWAAYMLVSGSYPDGWKLITLLIAALFSYVGIFSIGIPSFALLRKFNCLNLVTLSISGFIGGVIVLFLFGQILAIGIESSASINLAVSVWGGVQGVIIAILFGVIAGILIVTPNKAIT